MTKSYTLKEYCEQVREVMQQKSKFSLYDTNIAIPAELLLELTEVYEQTRQLQWIPVSERLPDETESVLIWMRPETVDDSIHNIMVSNPVFARKQAELGFVTHWMPLPAAPESTI